MESWHGQNRRIGPFSQDRRNDPGFSEGRFEKKELFPKLVQDSN